MYAALLFFVTVFVCCFLIGSIPWGLIISKKAYKKDLREEGSGNIGTTNALRTLGKRGGAAVFALDFGKGFVAGIVVLMVSTPLFASADAFLLPGFVELLEAMKQATGAPVAWAMQDATIFAMTVGFAGCVFGHVFCPWLKGKGGKGIAVAAGYLFFLFGPMWALFEIVLFAVLVGITRYVSVGSLVAAIACPIIGAYLFAGHWVSVGVIAVVALVIIWAHRSNIQRLFEGKENKISLPSQEIE